MLRPIGDRILVVPILKETKTESGIELAHNDVMKLNEGRVVACGPGLCDDTGKLVALQVKVGDQIAFSKFAGHKIELNKKQYLILCEHEVLGIEQVSAPTSSIIEQAMETQHA